jgi:threonine dehydrogenase-like Zn-dependent dehydrogenase
MKAATFEGTGKIVVKDVPDPVLQNPGQAIVKVTHSCICGSDLWFYRGLFSQGEGSRIGHEFMGVSKPSEWCQDRHGRRLRHRIVRHLRRR